MPPIDELARGCIDDGKAVGALVRRRAIFIQAGAIRGDPLKVTKRRFPSGVA